MPELCHVYAATVNQLLLCPFPTWRCYVDVKSHSVKDARIQKAEGKYHNKCSMTVVRL